MVSDPDWLGLQNLCFNCSNGERGLEGCICSDTPSFSHLSSQYVELEQYHPIIPGMELLGDLTPQDSLSFLNNAASPDGEMLTLDAQGCESTTRRLPQGDQIVKDSSDMQLSPSFPYDICNTRPHQIKTGNAELFEPPENGTLQPPETPKIGQPNIRDALDQGMRRRDYTPAEKETFERWITANPIPNKSQKLEYTKENNLTLSQLQNLINNRKRKAKKNQTLQKMVQNTTVEPSNKGHTLQESASPPENETAISLSISGTLAVPLTNSSIMGSLSRNTSYSSIGKYLEDPEDPVPVAAIEKAAQEYPPLPMSSLPGEISLISALHNDTPPKPLEEQPRSVSSFSSQRDDGEGWRSGWGDAVFLAVPGLRSGRGSIASDDLFSTGTGSVASIASIANSYTSSIASIAHSYTSSRIRMKKGRREKYMNVATWERSFFDSEQTWEEHEIAYHSQNQSTYFCMLGGPSDAQSTEKCLFCGSLLPTSNHYEEVHNLEPCDLPLDARTFSTRFDILQHLSAKHDLTSYETDIVQNELDYWGLKLNLSHNYGLWRCGYCGDIGADWDHRVKHIKGHWHNGGPRFTKIHPWRCEKAKFSNSDMEYLQYLFRGKKVDKIHRPQTLNFKGSEFYESVIKHRIRLKQWPELGTTNVHVEQTNDYQVPSDFTKVPSLFSQLASRTKSFLTFAKWKRRRNK
ncbi:hypothetical protein F5884DRAFT_898572 [Xylogone sp. PMI_703]|nr:hypothetical protein F5884DRAFT_898572 [Xylogone sp. PMI_703]